MSKSGYVHISVDEILRITDKAFRVLLDGEEIWLPSSQISDAGDYSEGDKDITLSITEWIANQKGIEGE